MSFCLVGLKDDVRHVCRGVRGSQEGPWWGSEVEGEVGNVLCINVGEGPGGDVGTWITLR